MGNKIWLVAALLLLAACSGKPAAQQAEAMAGSYAELTERYDLLHDQLNETTNLQGAARSAAELGRQLDRLKSDKKRELEKLLDRYRGARRSAALDLVRSKVMIEAGRYAEAEQIVARLASGTAATAAEAKLQLATLHLLQRRHAEAAKLLSEIGLDAARDAQYYNLCLALALSHPDPVAREGFSRQLIDAPRLPVRIKPMLPQLYANLAMLAREKRQAAEALAHWDKALALESDPLRKTAWEVERRQLALLDQPPPPLAADNWLNAQPPDIVQLKGKVLVIGFWAPGCAPCRQVLPRLQELYRRQRGQGLVVIGYTRLYGRFGDGSQEKGQVTAAEELSLIRAFVDRNRISFPIAVATEGEAFDAYAVKAIPTLVLIDRRGSIAFYKTGSDWSEQVEEKIAALLAEK